MVPITPADLNKIHADSEARAAKLKAEGLAEQWDRRKGLTRDEWRDQQIRWAFWRANTRYCQADRESTDDKLFMEAVHQSIQSARADERERIARAISGGLKVLLGEEFGGLMYDIAIENDINIGYD